MLYSLRQKLLISFLLTAMVSAYSYENGSSILYAPAEIKDMASSFIQLEITAPSGNIKCSSILINDHTILTAAHCVDQSEVSEIITRSLNQDYSQSFDTQSYKIHYHKSNIKDDSSNDIAIIKFSKNYFKNAKDLSKIMIIDYSNLSDLIFNPVNNIVGIGWSGGELNIGMMSGSHKGNIVYDEVSEKQNRYKSFSKDDIKSPDKVATDSFGIFIRPDADKPFWVSMEDPEFSNTNQIEFYQYEQKNPMHTEKGDSGGPLFAGNNKDGYYLIGIASSIVKFTATSSFTSLANPYFRDIMTK